MHLILPDPSSVQITSSVLIKIYKELLIFRDFENRVINLEPESMGTLMDKVYVGHPASIDQSGEGVARTVHSLLLDIGVNQQHMGRSYRGLCADGGILNVNLSDHLLQLCWGTSVIPESKKGKVIWVWDGAHIIELILDHSLAAFPVLKDSKDRLVSLT